MRIPYPSNLTAVVIAAFGQELSLGVTFQFLLVVCLLIELNGRYSASKFMTPMPQPGHMRSYRYAEINRAE